MKREVIEAFLNLPGVVGIALMDGHSRPYFYGVDQNLNFQQKEALAQGIQQVIETTPLGFNYFEFQFNGHQTYIYKLAHRVVLLVVTGLELVQDSYRTAIGTLKQELELDSANAIATFRLMAGNISLTNQNYWKQRAVATGNGHPLGSSPWSPVYEGASYPDGTQSASAAGRVATSATPLPSQTTIHSGLSELTEALNQVSRFAAHYLGPTVVKNYWNTTRPSAEWLGQLEVDRAGEFSCVATGAIAPLSPDQLDQVQTWVAAFMKRCAYVIRDFPQLIQQIPLNDQQKSLLKLPMP
ncbi:MAG: hypothetical protein KME20_13315 [Kaiparowitsia implicata GSE-PSE-MK54-09C]|jgi:hypothetical protein|nr:hypothetical protein [Kaiparowitsia implicata GSE-PSE-MK54-09C]